MFVFAFSTYAVVLDERICLPSGLCGHSRMAVRSTVTKRALCWVLTLATELFHGFGVFFFLKCTIGP